ncbi:hypothetical protein RKD30_002079 [Streptomyces pristinaespiralis]|uniref:Uncharacterized protein n=1 Tax=Streptomyces pristinaespiralis (strain ATCC 25486 / DSM 40338 / CBS 914.69 / JCM 4507 / KCC S-0507 / NBRC 13074 / NRRL 2958 / 5647) TaxID=457429 RepID=B5HJ47_STRE2|nr:conserved hypothetical protein [Streptomyces pristinaespiralis ATCC 25486]
MSTGPRIELVSDIPRLALLRFLRRVQEQQLAQTDRWIAEEERRTSLAAQRVRRTAPRDPGFVISHGIGAGRRPFEVHVGDCRMAQRTKPVTPAEARELLAEGVEPCQFCRPDSELGML